ncbi:MAG: HAMP domain-containing protein, partial [Geobacter sp.]
MRGYRPSLTFSILASLACLLVLTWVLFSLFALTTAERDLFAQKADHARMLLATFVNQLPEQLPTFPEGMLPLDASAAIYAGKLAEEQSFERLTLLDGKGKVIYTVGRDGSDQFQPFMATAERSDAGVILAGGVSLARTAPVLRDGQSVGRAGLVLSLAGEQLRLQRSRQLFIAYFALDFILLLGFGSAILSRIVVRPVNRLLTATERITGGVYGHQVAVAGPLELARLAESFNGMYSVLLQKQ